MIKTFSLAILLATAAGASAAITYTSHFTTAGETVDLSSNPLGLPGLDPTFAGNRLSFGSDLYFERSSSTYWGITDRGPGGGVVDFAPRVHQFSFDISSTGAASNFSLLQTIVFKQADGSPFTGLNPLLAPQNNKSVLDASFDPEGFERLANGNLLVSDEYGPSVYEFDADGVFIRAFETPANLVPREADSTINYVDGRPTIVNGRQDNRGFEGLTVSVDGTKLYAIMQDPLVNEGPVNSGEPQGRRGRNLRIVEFDIATGKQTAQYAYVLESRADINDRIPGTADDFGVNAQGRNIGVSSITALANGKFLVIERDNRGLGVEFTGQPIGTKRVFLIDIAGATDVKDISFEGLTDLPAGVTSVSKSLYLDIYAELTARGVTTVEKLEGLSFGQDTGSGRALVIVSDNDFSVTQDPDTNVQFNVCDNGVPGTFPEVALDVACPAGSALIPTYAYVFNVTGESLTAAGIPEPASWALMIGGFGLVGGALRRRRLVPA